MRKLVFNGLTAVLLGLLGCSGSDSPTEPGTAPPGNWVGTITGEHAALHLDGTCALTMNLDPAFNGQWRVDCPGGGSRGEVLSRPLRQPSGIMALTTIDPASTCPWTASAATAGSTIDGQFQVTDCSTHAVIGSGTIQLRRQ